MSKRFQFMLTRRKGTFIPMQIEDISTLNIEFKLGWFYPEVSRFYPVKNYLEEVKKT